MLALLEATPLLEVVDLTPKVAAFEETDSTTVVLRAADVDLVDEVGTTEDVTAEAMIPATNPPSPGIGL